jgi:hypothetical protein
VLDTEFTHKLQSLKKIIFDAHRLGPLASER